MVAPRSDKTGLGVERSGPGARRTRTHHRWDGNNALEPGPVVKPLEEQLQQAGASRLVRRGREDCQLSVGHRVARRMDLLVTPAQKAGAQVGQVPRLHILNAQCACQVGRIPGSGVGPWVSDDDRSAHVHSPRTMAAAVGPTWRNGSVRRRRCEWWPGEPAVHELLVVGDPLLDALLRCGFALGLDVQVELAELLAGQLELGQEGSGLGVVARPATEGAASPQARRPRVRRCGVQRTRHGVIGPWLRRISSCTRDRERQRLLVPSEWPSRAWPSARGRAAAATTLATLAAAIHPPDPRCHGGPPYEPPVD